MVSGCETDKEKSITGDYFNRSPGNLESITVDPDSISTAVTYKAQIGYESYTLAGRYENITAFSVFKFFKLSQSVIDSLFVAKLQVTVNNIWKTGDFEFGIYHTTSDWSDTTRLDNDTFTAGLGSPISVVSDTSSYVSTLTFNIPIDEFSTWSDYGSFLIKNTESGMAMASLSSDNSSSSPFIEIVTHNAGSLDTTKVKSVEGTYYIIHEGVDIDKPVLSDGGASGFVLHINLPEFAPSPTAIHKCILTMALKENLIPTSFLPVYIYQLTEGFTTFEDISTVAGNVIDLVITPDVSIYTIDISDYIDSWHNFGKPNYGLLFKPLPICTSPNYAVIEPVDSLVITYTTLPEVD